MPKWDDYKKAAKERGSLALELYAVISTKASEDADIPSVLPDHLAYQAQQEAAGRLAFAGPLSDLSGEEMVGDGLIIYRCASMDEARRIAEADPMHEKGIRTFVLRKWMINEGSLTLNVGLSGQRVSMA